MIPSPEAQRHLVRVWEEMLTSFESSTFPPATSPTSIDAFSFSVRPFAPVTAKLPPPSPRIKSARFANVTRPLSACTASRTRIARQVSTVTSRVMSVEASRVQLSQMPQVVVVLEEPERSPRSHAAAERLALVEKYCRVS